MNSYTHNELPANLQKDIEAYFQDKMLVRVNVKLLALTTAKEEAEEEVISSSADYYDSYIDDRNEITEQLDTFTYIKKYVLGDSVTGKRYYLESKLGPFEEELERLNKYLEEELEYNDYEKVVSGELEYDEDHAYYDELNERNESMKTIELIQYAVNACNN
ncbi:hypothetical protein [Psychromonas aquimarina]|uniref:hypothetical protein n=1 Tax=Psychromonas aquimarina TaxID=444919 RepID=UPI00048AF4D0|nr:hypothetical protein [Psychromonas aquimarina]